MIGPQVFSLQQVHDTYWSLFVSTFAFAYAQWKLGFFHTEISTAITTSLLLNFKWVQKAFLRLQFATSPSLDVGYIIENNGNHLLVTTGLVNVALTPGVFKQTYLYKISNSAFEFKL